MNTFWIIMIIISVCLVIVLFSARKIYKNRLSEILIREEKLKTQFIENANKGISIWIINKYTENDINLLWANKDLLLTIMKYFEYQIAIKTDLLRINTDKNSFLEKQGFVNCLHESHTFFYKLYHKKPKKEEKKGQDLI